MNEVNVGVIGTGWMGSLHAKVLSRLPGAKLVAVADPDVERASLAAREADGCTVYQTYDELLSDDRVQAVSICTRDTLHLAPVRAAAQAGKHVFLEKPIASNVEEAEAIISACHAAGVKLAIGFLLRFDPRFRHIKDLLERGALGEPIHVYARRNSPRNVGPARYGGSLPLALHVTSHDVDAVLWYLHPRQPVSVYAQSVSKLFGSLGIDDSILSIVRFDDGTLAEFESSWALPETSRTQIDARMEVLCTEGVVEIDGAEAGVYVAGRNGVDYPDTYYWPEVGGMIAGDLREELADFVDAVALDRPVSVTGEEGLAALRVVLKMIESARSGRAETIS
jgi:predicted dehydrogenase